MSRRLKKIKGGLNPRYVELIRNLNNPNNLKTFKELNEARVLKFIKKEETQVEPDADDDFEEYDDGYYFEDGDLIQDPISKKRVKYEDAILINGFLYNIDELFEWVIIHGHRTDGINLPINNEDIKKIKFFYNKNDFEVEHLIDYSKYNNLKSLALLKSSGYIDDDNFLIDKDSNQRINGKNSNERIKYENAIIINGVLYDINNLLEYLRTNKIDISQEDKLKIQALKIDFITVIKSNGKFNNLKPIKELKDLRFIDEDEEIIDREGEKIKDPLTNKPIKYENAILINRVLYDINNLLELLDNNQIQERIIGISEADLEKIKTFKFDISFIKDNTRYNNLKTFEDLIRLNIFETKHDEYFFVKRDGQLFKDPVSKEKITYKQAFLLGEVLYDINVLFEWVIIKKNYTDPVSNSRLSDEDISKIGNYNVDIELISNPLTPNNLKTIQELKMERRVLNGINNFLDKNGNVFQILLFGNRLYRSKNLDYKNAILINGFLYDVNELYNYLFTGKNKFFYIKKLFEEILKIEDTIKIYNLKHKINPYFQDNITKFNKSLEELTIYCQKIKTKIQIIDRLITDFDITKLREISTLIVSVLWIYDFDIYKTLISISTISDLRVRASIILIDTMIEVFKCFSKCLLALYKFGDSNQDCNSYRIKLFNVLLIIIENINDISYYTFQLVIAVGIKEQYFSRDYLNDFEKVLNEINEIVKASKENSARILEIQKEINLYKNEILKLFVSISPSMNRYRKKELIDACESIKKEHLDVLKNYFKSQENLFDIYRFCNSRFMNFSNHQRKNNQVLVTKAELLFQNIDKLHMKSNQNLEKAKKTFEKYQDYKSPKFFQRVKRTFRNFSKKIGLPVEPSPKSPSLQTISPSIQVYSPSP